MPVNRRKKNSRQRASHTHGWGAKKKHRGTGNRGGKGRAGSGKRADAKKPSNWSDPYYFGKHGFHSVNKIELHGINIADIEDRLKTWLLAQQVTQEQGMYVVDLEKLGYNKLLSRGAVHTKLKIISPYASENAVRKIKEAGGEVAGLLQTEPAPQK